MSACTSTPTNPVAGRTARRPAASQRQIWNALHPHGKIDLEADVSYDSRLPQAKIDLRLVPHGELPPSDGAWDQVQPTSVVGNTPTSLPSTQAAGALVASGQLGSPDDIGSIGTSIEPVAFPYRMENCGAARSTIARQSRRTEDLRHRAPQHDHAHRRVVRLSPDGSWRLQLERLGVDRVRLHGEDHELVAALPEALRRAVTELSRTGPINLKGKLWTLPSATRAAPLETQLGRRPAAAPGQCASRTQAGKYLRRRAAARFVGRFPLYQLRRVEARQSDLPEFPVHRDFGAALVRQPERVPRHAAVCPAQRSEGRTDHGPALQRPGRGRLPVRWARCRSIA